MSTHATVRPTTSSRSVIVQRGPGEPLTLEPRRRREAVVARLLSPWLDARIAHGVAPESGRLLAARAAQLVDPTARRSLADAWDLLLVRATRPWNGIDPRVPVARGDVLAVADEVAELATALRSASPVSAGDVARARALLTDGTGPVYRRGSSLRTAVTELVEALTDGG